MDGSEEASTSKGVRTDGRHHAYTGSPYPPASSVATLLPSPGPSSDSLPEDEELRLSDLKDRGRSRLRPIPISCPLVTGKQRCDAELESNAMFELHILNHHLAKLRAQWDAGDPIPDIKWSRIMLNWKKITDLEELLKIEVQREANSFCVLRECKQPHTAKAADHYSNTKIHPPKPWTVADLYPSRFAKEPPKPPTPLPQALPPYLYTSPVIQPYTEGGQGPRIADNPLLRLRPRAERYLPLRDRSAPFLSDGLPFPQASSLSSDIFPLLEDVDDITSVAGSQLSQSRTMPSTPESKRRRARSQSMVPLSPSSSRASVPPVYKLTRSMGPPPLPSGNKMVTLTAPLEIRPLRPGESNPVPSAATPGRGVRLVSHSTEVKEIPNPLQYIDAVREEEVKRNAENEREFRKRREESERDLALREEELQKQEAKVEVRDSNSEDGFKALEVPHHSILKRKRPTPSDLEAAADLYARKISGARIGTAYWAALADYREGSRLFIQQIQAEGGWVD